MARKPGPPTVRVHISMEQKHYEWLLLRHGKNGQIKRGKMSDLINRLLSAHIEEDKKYLQIHGLLDEYLEKMEEG